MHGVAQHSIGSLLPEEGQPSKFAQLYIFDSDHKLQHCL